MKHFFLALLLVLASCSALPSPLAGEAEAVGTVSVGVGVGMPLTRASGSYDACECLVRDVQFFSFDADGRLYDYVRSRGESAVLQARIGMCRLCALVNAPDLSWVRSDGELLSARTSLSDNSLLGFVMSSPLDSCSFYDLSRSCSLTLPVRRLVSKIIVGRITGAFDASLSRYECVLVSMWLEDVAADMPLATEGGPSALLCGCEDNGDNVNMLIADMTVGYDLRDGRSTTRQHGFYVYPNADGRPVRLCMRIILDGEPRECSVDIPVTERNTVYNVERVSISDFALNQQRGGLVTKQNLDI